jgi:UDP-N-acetylmuramate dehydrogenase
MELLKNRALSSFSTFRVGGKCDNLWLPENEDDLRYLWDSSSNSFNYIIANGSNILIDSRTYSDVICTKKLKNTEIVCLENGKYCVGAGVLLKDLINRINNDGKGGIEYLWSVPGTVGGATVMNAGRGEVFNQKISDYIECVNVFYRGKLLVLKKQECDYSYRSSIFLKNKDMIILSVIMSFEEMNRDKSEMLKKDRMQLVNKIQDNTYPNMGSIFKKCSIPIMKMLQDLEKDDNNISFSKKTYNWLINKNNGTYKEARKKIDDAISIHKILGETIELEIVDWGAQM